MNWISFITVSLHENLDHSLKFKLSKLLNEYYDQTCHMFFPELEKVQKAVKVKYLFMKSNRFCLQKYLLEFQTDFRWFQSLKVSQKI